MERDVQISLRSRKSVHGKDFPKSELCKIGYRSWFLPHDRYYHGVAILVHQDFLSRCNLPMPEMLDCELPGDDRNESRFLTVGIGKLWVSSVYAPFSPTIEHRVAWLNRLRDHVSSGGYLHHDSLLCAAT